MRRDLQQLDQIYTGPDAPSGNLLQRLYWPSAPDLVARYAAMLSPIDFGRYSPQRRLRLLDIGCGFGLLLDYLQENDLLDRVDYTGVDVLGSVLDEARSRWPGVSFEKRDVRDLPYPENAFDYCIVCGIFTSRFTNTHNDMVALAEGTLKALWPSVTQGMSFNSMSKHVDWERDDLFHWPLDEIMAFCKRDLSRHVTFRLDYGLWEVSTLVKKEPTIAVGRTPSAWGEAPAFDVVKLADIRRSPRFGMRSATGCDEFDYAPGQPNLFMLMNLKQFLVRTHGVATGFEHYRRVISTHREAHLKPLKLESHHTYCVAQALVFREIFPAGEPTAVAAPRVIGQGNHRTLTNTSRSFYIACIENAVVRGRSSVIEAGGLALADFQGDELARIDDEVEFDSGVFYRNDDQVWMIEDARPARHLANAFTLLGARTDFFGDWLWDSIHRYVAATLRADLPTVPILIDADMPPSHRQALELLLPEPVEIVEIAAFEMVQVDQLWSAPGVGYMAFHQRQNDRFKWDYFLTAPTTSAAVKEAMALRAGPRLGAPQDLPRVFLARKAFRHRKLTNRLDIETIAADAGFAIVYPEEMDFDAQARLLRDARFVIAPEGSALFLTSFLQSGAQVCILNHEETEGLVLYNESFPLRGIDLTIITGRQSGTRSGGRLQDADYTIDTGVFRQFLDQWLSDSGD